MAYRRKTSTRRKPAVRRRRRSMGRVTTAGVQAAAMSAAKSALGGIIAAYATNTVGKTFGETFQPYTGLVGSLATSLFLKQPEIAAGMAGYSGVAIARSFIPDGDFKDALGLAGNDYAVSPSMYLQGYDTPGMAGENIYASNYTLAGYDVPGM